MHRSSLTLLAYALAVLVIALLVVHVLIRGSASDNGVSAVNAIFLSPLNAPSVLQLPPTLAVESGGERVYLALPNYANTGHRIIAVDSTTGRLLRSISVSQQPTALVADDRQHLLVAALPSPGEIAVWDTTSWKAVKVLRATQTTYGLAYDQPSGTLVVLDSGLLCSGSPCAARAGTLSVYGLRTWNLSSVIRLPASQVLEAGIDVRSHLIVAVRQYFGDSLTIVDSYSVPAGRLQSSQSVPLIHTYIAPFIDHVGNHVLIVGRQDLLRRSEGSTVLVVDLKTGALMRAVQVPSRATSAVLSQSAGRLYLVDGRSLVALDLRTLKARVVAASPGGTSMLADDQHGLIFTASGAQADSASGHLRLTDVVSNAAVEDHGICASPILLAVDARVAHVVLYCEGTKTNSPSIRTLSYASYQAHRAK